MDENIEKDGVQSPLQVEPISGVFSKFCPLASSPTLMHIFKSSTEVSTLVSPPKKQPWNRCATSFWSQNTKKAPAAENAWNIGPGYTDCSQNVWLQP